MEARSKGEWILIHVSAHHQAQLCVNHGARSPWLTAHDVWFIKLRVLPVHLVGTFTKLVDILLNVPAPVLIKHGKHGLLLPVCCPLWGESACSVSHGPAQYLQPWALLGNQRGTAVGTPEAKGIMRKQTANQKIQRLKYPNRNIPLYHGNWNSVYLGALHLSAPLSCRR